MSQAKDAGRLVGLDYLRAFFSICVVACHLGYVYPSSIFSKATFRSHTFTWSDFVNFYVLCLAVPVFILISAYLYALKEPDALGFKRRMWRIIRLLVFWSVLFNIYEHTGFLFLRGIPQDRNELALYLISGLNSYYYFFLSLAVVTAVTHYSMRLSAAVLWLLFALSTLVVGLLPVLHAATGYRIIAHHADPLNFLPFAFAGVLFARYTRSGSVRLLDGLAVGCLTLAALSALLDWTVYVNECFFQVNKFALPAYSRPALIFLACAVLILAIRWRPRTNSVVRFMSVHSLGLYCLHPFFIFIRWSLVQRYDLTGLAEVVLPLAVVVGFSYFCSLLLPYFLRDELIR